MAEISVVLPVFNEEKNIWLLAEKYAKLREELDLEVLFVEDGGSSDNTRAELAKVHEKYPYMKPVLTDQPGYGISIYNGLKQATGNYVAWTHADLQTDPFDVKRALHYLKAQKDPDNTYVKGDRKGRPFMDQFFTRGMSVFETLYLGTKLHDINAQPNVMHRRFAQELAEPPHDFSFDLYTLYLAKRKGMNLVRFNVEFPPRLHGQSAWNTSLKAKLKFIKRTFKFTFNLDKRLREIGYAKPHIFKRYWGLSKELLLRKP